jgi:cytochrome d ubiquinol oxidase subunit I
MRTSDAVTPTLSTGAALVSLLFFGAIYALIFSFGVLYIYRLLATGPAGTPAGRPGNAKRPLAITGAVAAPQGEKVQ